MKKKKMLDSLIDYFNNTPEEEIRQQWANSEEKDLGRMTIEDFVNEQFIDSLMAIKMEGDVKVDPMSYYEGLKDMYNALNG